jgi:hypothetical protein
MSYEHKFPLFCVYKIHDVNKNGCYIGVTSVELNKRFKQHLYKLKNSKHTCHDLQTFYNNENPDLIIEILHSGLRNYIARDLELKLIYSLPNCFNLKKLGVRKSDTMPYRVHLKDDEYSHLITNYTDLSAAIRLLTKGGKYEEQQRIIEALEKTLSTYRNAENEASNY